VHTQAEVLIDTYVRAHSQTCSTTHIRTHQHSYTLVPAPTLTCAVSAPIRLEGLQYPASVLTYLPYSTKMFLEPASLFTVPGASAGRTFLPKISGQLSVRMRGRLCKRACLHMLPPKQHVWLPSSSFLFSLSGTNPSQILPLQYTITAWDRQTSRSPQCAVHATRAAGRVLNVPACVQRSRVCLCGQRQPCISTG
jgi:hypothetical protein